jgi:hypothetical protein
LAQYESDLESGIGLMKGQLLEPDQTAAIGENLVAAAAALGATSTDGDPLFDPAERAEKLAGIGYAVLDAGLGVDIGPEMSLDAVAQLADPNFNYTVAIGGDGSDPMVFQRKDLPPQLQKKFTDGPAQKVATFLKNQNDLAAVEHFAAIYDGLDSYIPGNDGDRKAGELYARVQMDRTPFTPETLDVHTNNLRWYLQNCGFLPRSYADELAKLCNSADPLAATMGATLIDKSLEINPAAVEALDDDVVTRALLVTAELGGGTPMDVAVTRATQAMDRAMNRDRDAIDRELKAQKTGAAAGKFYGGAVTVDQYGHDGRDFFRHLVDANFRLNGGNRDLAVKRALAATRARYVETNVGFYGGRGRRVANAPEAVFGPKSAEYINRVLESHRQEITQKSAMPFEVSRLKLVATPETDRAIQTGQRPEWLLLRANDDGTADYYIDRATGRPMTFSLPDGAEDEITRWLHRMPSLDPLADDGAGAFFNLGAQLAKTHPLETAGQFFKKIWARKGESADAQ